MNACQTKRKKNVIIKKNSNGDFCVAKYKVTDTDLAAVAGAIKDKSCTTANLTWPDDYIDEIGKLELDPLYSLRDLTISNTLDDNSWDIISQVAQADVGDEFWDISDKKQIILNSAIGSYLTLSNYTTYVFILDFNHPISENTSDNNIIFGGFITALFDGKDIALINSGYNSTKTSGKYFNFNHIRINTTLYGSNYGG